MSPTVYPLLLNLSVLWGGISTTVSGFLPASLDSPRLTQMVDAHDDSGVSD